ncbi:hypothetical protein [Bosea sp. ANAM02]|uniref:hypothetical protein n=1 Tax=Bosea sp. ANAM02 TaxID=2020412 RepID=UPI00140EC54E|nr:hypothetical protein [Bosea sp. ANAM02]BCB22300.1 hypothetical protein OCUBac02_51940 [Bosea sp. ANAM02]
MIGIYVPRPGSPAETMIRPHSAVVATIEDGADMASCFFEGNVHGAQNLRSFHDRLVVAAGRLTCDYPTTARALVPVGDLIKVASYDPRFLAVRDVTDGKRLSDWAGEPVESITGVTLPVGRRTWSELSAVSDELRPVGARSMFAFRSRAGQILVFGPDKVAEVLAGDDPRAQAFAIEPQAPQPRFG